ncbi:MAG: LPS export ABC transporter permease LptF [Gammaproteobacteria bacterium]|nr:LPS export ABC transporter permease LptF [Gammaproteobacteria bacterium]
MVVIDRYIIVEILQTLLAVLVVLLLIFMGRYFAVYLADAAAGEIAGVVVIDLLLLRTVSALNMMLPFSLYIAVLLAFGRFYKDSEMTALASSGVGVTRVLRPILALSLVFTVIVALLSLWLSPWAEAKRASIIAAAEANSDLDGVLPGQFNQIGKRDKVVFYVGELSDDRQTMKNVFVQLEKNGQSDVLSASQGYKYLDKETGDRYLVFEDGYRYQGIPGSRNFTIQRYQKNAIRIDAPSVGVQRQRNRAIPTNQLWRSDELREKAELQWRLSMPVSTLLLAIIGVLLSKTTPRQGRFAKLFIAIMVYVIYNNMISIARSWIEQDKLPVELGVWWVHLLLLLFIFIALYKQMTGRFFLISARLLRLPFLSS